MLKTGRDSSPDFSTLERQFGKMLTMMKIIMARFHVIAYHRHFECLFLKTYFGQE